jgi:hypothetical protein
LLPSLPSFFLDCGHEFVAISHRFLQGILPGSLAQDRVPIFVSLTVFTVRDRLPPVRPSPHDVAALRRKTVLRWKRHVAGGQRKRNEKNERNGGSHCADTADAGAAATAAATSASAPASPALAAITVFPS